MENKITKTFMVLLLLFVPQGAFSTKVTLLTELHEHRQVLRKALQEAENEIILVSPFISSNAITEDDLPALIKDAHARGVKITVYTDRYFSSPQNPQAAFTAQQGKFILRELFCDLQILDGGHTKTLIVDDSWMATGSFNWLSASRAAQWANLEHSILLEEGEGDQDDALQTCIQKAKASIEATEKVDHPYRTFYRDYIEGFFTSKGTDLIDWLSDHIGTLSNHPNAHVAFDNSQYWSDKIVEFQKLYYPDEEDCDEEGSDASDEIEPLLSEKDYVEELRNFIHQALDVHYLDH